MGLLSPAGGQSEEQAGGRLPRWARFGNDRPWLIVLAAVTATEAAWWAVIRALGMAPAPFLLPYLAAAFGALSLALILCWAVGRQSALDRWPSMAVAAALVGIGASLFLPIKYAIPRLVPFWLDQPLASAERAAFGADPWLILDRWLGWAAVPMDRVYGLWLPTQLAVLFIVLTQPPSPAKSRALSAYFLAWFLLGVVAATLLSSAGPLFHDRLLGGREFAALGPTLRQRGAWMVLSESDAMWASLASARPGIVAGISAVPSIHVAISVWMILAARRLAPRAVPLAIAYAAVIWVGSVQLGWHYIVDGLAGAIGMLGVWSLSAKLGAASRRP